MSFNRSCRLIHMNRPIPSIHLVISRSVTQSLYSLYHIPPNRPFRNTILAGFRVYTYLLTYLDVGNHNVAEQLRLPNRYLTKPTLEHKMVLVYAVLPVISL